MSSLLRQAKEEQEHWMQGLMEGKIKNAEQRALAVEQRAATIEKESSQKVDAASQRATLAEQRALVAEQRAARAEQRLKEAVDRFACAEEAIVDSTEEKKSEEAVVDSKVEEKKSLREEAKINPRDFIVENTNTATTVEEDDRLGYMTSCLSVVVVGGSGDLAKKKTFPSLLNLYADDLLPKNLKIWAYARSDTTSEALREKLRPYLEKGKEPGTDVIDNFLSLIEYHRGPTYGDLDAFTQLRNEIEEYESTVSEKKFNRLFYFAIPPNVFEETACAIKQTCMQQEGKGWIRLIVEKPFGRDLESFEKLEKGLSSQFPEDHLYRIDHYLGKEMVQNLTVIRFSNMWFERVWNRENMQMIILTFKEPFGTDGRGGYFDQFGIIRDILQNHLLQVLTLLTCESPVVAEGPRAGNAIRDAKVQVLKSIPPIELEDCVLGQYEGYADDPTITNKDTNTPTFAAIRLKINNPRWAGVPIILKAGKALDERKAEMRLQLRDAPAAHYLFGGRYCPRNEIVLRLQPDEAIYLKTNVKKPGFDSEPIQSEMQLNYDSRFFPDCNEHASCKKCRLSNPDAYTRLILDCLQGQQGAFVRDDELRRAWEIFTPVLHKIENMNIRPITYAQGSRGPIEADEFIAQCGFNRNENYNYPKSK